MNAHPMSPVELGNLQVGSELRVMGAKDVSSPRPLDDFHGMPLDVGTGGGLLRVPRGAVEDPDSPWYRRRRGDRPSEPPTPTPQPQPPYMGQGL